MELKGNDIHKCVMNDRKYLELMGIKTVMSFDTEEILLDTFLGGLLIKGNDLHINQLNLDKGIIDVEGKIDALIYSDKSPAESTTKGILSRLFRYDKTWKSSWRI